MTTLRKIITYAFREGNIISSGETPEADQFEEALWKLDNLIRNCYGFEAGEQLETINYGSLNLDNSFAKAKDVDEFVKATYIPSNVSLMANNEGTITLYMDPRPRDGAMVEIVDVAGNFATYPITLNGNGRKIESATTLTLNTDGLSRKWFYRADLAGWVRISDLTADSEMPFPSEFDEYFVTALALRISPQYGSEVSPETMRAMERTLKRMKSRYAQERRVDPPLALQRIGEDSYSFSDTDEFGLGNIRGL